MPPLSVASSRATIPSALRAVFAAGRPSQGPVHQRNLRLLPNRYPGTISCHNLRSKRLYSTQTEPSGPPRGNQPSSAPERPGKNGAKKDKTISKNPNRGRPQRPPKKDRKERNDSKNSKSKRPTPPPPKPALEEGEEQSGKGPVLWQTQKAALKKKFKDVGWQPQKKLSPDAMDGIRQLHATNPEHFSTPVLADHFKVSPEAIRRILKSSWRPSEEEMDRRRARWHRRYHRIWGHMTQLGLRKPTDVAKPFSDAGVLYDDGKDPFQ